MGVVHLRRAVGRSSEHGGPSFVFGRPPIEPKGWEPGFGGARERGRESERVWRDWRDRDRGPKVGYKRSDRDDYSGGVELRVRRDRDKEPRVGYRGVVSDKFVGGKGRDFNFVKSWQKKERIQGGVVEDFKIEGRGQNNERIVQGLAEEIKEFKGWKNKERKLGVQGGEIDSTDKGFKTIASLNGSWCMDRRLQVKRARFNTYKGYRMKNPSHLGFRAGPSDHQGCSCLGNNIIRSTRAGFYGGREKGFLDGLHRRFVCCIFSLIRYRFGLLVLGGCWVLGGGGLFCAFVGVAAVVWGVGFGGLLFVGLQVGWAGVSGWGVLVWVALCFVLFFIPSFLVGCLGTVFGGVCYLSQAYGVVMNYGCHSPNQGSVLLMAKSRSAVETDVKGVDSVCMEVCGFVAAGVVWCVVISRVQCLGLAGAGGGVGSGCFMGAYCCFIQLDAHMVGALFYEGDPCLEEGGRSYNPATCMEEDCDEVAEVSGFDKGQEAHHVALVDDLDLRVERGRYQTKSYLKRNEEEDKEEDEGLELWSDACVSSCPFGSWAFVLVCLCFYGFVLPPWFLVEV
ncbi:hypothetical protein U1Q18_045899 [Sarracenia purpurea var. burkii]